MKYSIIIIFVFYCLQLSASSEQDSLLNALKSESNDSVKTQILYELSNSTKGKTRLQYLSKAIEYDSLFNHKILGYKPFFNIANLKINSNKTDSVLYYLEKAMQLAKQSNDSSTIAKILQTYGVYYRFIGDDTMVISYSNEAKEIFKSLKDSINYYKLVCNVAYTYYRMSNVEQAQNLFNEIIHNARHPRDSWIIGSSNLGLGAIMNNQTQYKKALNHYFKAYEIWKGLNDTTYFCRALNNIGVTYKRLSMYDLAMSTYQEIISINPSQDEYAIPLAQANISTIYSTKKEYNKANEFIDLAIAKIDSTGNLYYITVLKNIKADILIDEKKYTEAIPYLEETLKISKEHGFSNPYGLALNLYADVRYNTHDYDEALKYAYNALDQANKIKNKQQIFNNNYLIGKILDKKGQSALASSYLLKGLELNDSIQEEEEDHNILEATLTYELGKKDAINESLHKETELNKTIIKKTNSIVKLQKLYILIIALFLVCSLVFLVIVYRNNKIKRKLNKKLSASNQKIHEKNEKLHELVNTNSVILSIISHDLRTPLIALHNSILILSDPEIDKSQKEKTSISTENQVNTAIDLLENILKWAQTHNNSIQINLAKVNICFSIQQNINLIQASVLNKEIKLINNCQGKVDALGDEDLINMTLRNLFSNAIKFTPRKGTIEITADIVDNKVVICVSDNGIGISKENQKKILSSDEFISKNGTENEKGSGLGLKLCYKYIQYMNGEFIIKSTYEKGSTFIVKLPVYSNQIS